MKQSLVDHFGRYTLAYLAALGYAALASLGAFIDIFGALTRERAAALPWWGILAYIGKCVMPGLAAILAFQNQMLSRAKAGESLGQTTPPIPR